MFDGYHARVHNWLRAVTESGGLGIFMYGHDHNLHAMAPDDVAYINMGQLGENLTGTPGERFYAQFVDQNFNGRPDWGNEFVHLAMLDGDPTGQQTEWEDPNIVEPASPVLGWAGKGFGTLCFESGGVQVSFYGIPGIDRNAPSNAGLTLPADGDRVFCEVFAHGTADRSQCPVSVQP